MKTYPDDPAVPCNNPKGSTTLDDYRGLTKREEFAKAAMQGIIISSFNAHGNLPKDTAEFALSNADALIEALNKEVKDD